MAHVRQIVALAVLGASATADAFAPSAVAPTRRGQRMRATSLRMQQQGDNKPKVGNRPSTVAMTAVLDATTDETKAAPAAPTAPAASAALDTKTILRVPWGASVAAEVTEARMESKKALEVEAPKESVKVPEVQKAEALQSTASVDEKKVAPAQAAQAAPAVRAAAKPKQEAKEEPNEFAMMALKAGFLKQSSPLIMSAMAGNKGFDPAGFAKSADLLLQYREAELKHARLAMLASVGWVMSELWHTGLSDLLGKDNLLQEDAGEFLAKAPSVLNGGLQNVPAFFWVVTLLFSGVIP
jgi:hypothetical protein